VTTICRNKTPQARAKGNKRSSQALKQGIDEQYGYLGIAISPSEPGRRFFGIFISNSVHSVIGPDKIESNSRFPDYSILASAKTPAKVKHIPVLDEL
jgi:hypothetical protein